MLEYAVAYAVAYYAKSRKSLKHFGRSPKRSPEDDLLPFDKSFFDPFRLRNSQAEREGEREVPFA